MHGGGTINVGPGLIEGKLEPFAAFYLLVTSRGKGRIISLCNPI